MSQHTASMRLPSPIDEVIHLGQEEGNYKEHQKDTLARQKTPWHMAGNTTSDDVQNVRQAITSLSWPQKTSRQHSQKRDRLLPMDDVDAQERNGIAKLSRSQGQEVVKLDKLFVPSSSEPNLATFSFDTGKDSLHGISSYAQGPRSSSLQHRADLVEWPDHKSSSDVAQDQEDYEGIDITELRQDYEASWILNLSVHFRDKSNREKFFITYVQGKQFWRRMTISLDYRDACEGSLEAELDSLHYQRDKSFRIFEALRDSLLEIKFYDTVTNLKLVTTPEDMQLHVHVREDANEIITYPDPSSFEHINCHQYTESELTFDSHISGFVYKVIVRGRILIKKEIPGVDTVDEFIYEVNALNSLLECSHVMPLAGLITNNDRTEVKGLLVDYATKGALVDALYDWDVDDLPWSLRLKWAEQIIAGLSAIHEAGYVQGDFTLSNIVIDEDDDVHIIDINRRGCPIGWEPPELSILIGNGHRVSMYIGVKTDIFQLGMVLWALAELNDEPERSERPLRELDDQTPAFYRRTVLSCLQERPQDRSSASTLATLFREGLQQWKEADSPSVQVKPAQTKASLWRPAEVHHDAQVANHTDWDLDGVFERDPLQRTDSRPPSRGRRLRHRDQRPATSSTYDGASPGDAHSSTEQLYEARHLPLHLRPTDSGFDEPRNDESCA